MFQHPFERGSEERNREVCLVQLVLPDAEVPLRYLKAAVIEDFHENDGGHVLIDPRVVAEGFTEGMAGDRPCDAQKLDCLLYDAPGLDAADRRVLLPAV